MKQLNIDKPNIGIGKYFSGLVLAPSYTIRYNIQLIPHAMSWAFVD